MQPLWHLRQTLPAEVLTQKTPHSPPRVGKGCTGCFACYNSCPEDAISAVATPQGKGVYRGPTPSMKKLFSLPKPLNKNNKT